MALSRESPISESSPGAYDMILSSRSKDQRLEEQDSSRVCYLSIYVQLWPNLYGKNMFKLHFCSTSYYLVQKRGFPGGLLALIKLLLVYIFLSNLITHNFFFHFFSSFLFHFLVFYTFVIVIYLFIY